MAHAPRVEATPARRRPPLVDPRDGDIEDDESSPERRSLLALAGNLLAEVSLPKVVAALLLLVVLPAVALGVAPLVATIWFDSLAVTPRAGAAGAALFIAALLALGWIGGRKLWRLVESSFWALNAMAIQPVYAACREGMLHLAARAIDADSSERKHARVRAWVSALSGLLICAIAIWVVTLAWPFTRWVGDLDSLRTPTWLAPTALANATVLGAAYLAAAALAWGIADAMMPQPLELQAGAFRPRGALVRSWRVAHLSDIHVVGERFGFRLGSGRGGPRGNVELQEVLRLLDELHRRDPLDAILITGDLTDAGTSAEWAELLEMLAEFPRITDLIVALPGNHDVNVVDRANPARFDLPTSPRKRLRQVRTLSALAAMQGARMQVVDVDEDRIADTVDHTIMPAADDIVAFAHEGSRRRARATEGVWESLFPMVQLPRREDGLGIIALNSNAETHFSFTNALGLVSSDQARALDIATTAYPHAYWIVALHHHVVEHPRLGHALAERIGTTLINGNWFVRRLLRIADRAVVMHGHRHIDWIGECGGLLIVSAPSATMMGKGEDDIHFHVHTVGIDAAGRIALAKPERVTVGRARRLVDHPPRAR